MDFEHKQSSALIAMWCAFMRRTLHLAKSELGWGSRLRFYRPREASRRRALLIYSLRERNMERLRERERKREARERGSSEIPGNKLNVFFSFNLMNSYIHSPITRSLSFFFFFFILILIVLDVCRWKFI